MSETISIKAGKLIGVRTSIFTIFNQEKYDPVAIPTLWKSFFAAATDTDTELLKSEIFYGASIPSMSIDSPMDYYAGAIVALDVEVPKGLESVEIPAGSYLQIDHKGPISNLAASYQKAYTEVLPASGYEMRPAPHLEIYNSTLDPMDTNYQMAIAVPIVS